MSDEIMNAQPGQAGDLGGNAGSNPVTAYSQASNSVPNQSPDVSWEDRERDFLAKAYQQTQSLISKSETRQTNNIQGMIDQFKRDYGVTLTEQQAQEMAQNQAAKSLPNVQAQAQAPAQQAPAQDPQFQGFKYYHGMTDRKDLAPLYRQMYDIQNTIGVQLEKSDEEYIKFTHPEKKYTQGEFIDAWRQACIDKMLRLKSAQQTDEKKGTNLGQMPLVGSRGNKAKEFDPKRTTKSYIEEYMKGLNL